MSQFPAVRGGQLKATNFRGKSKFEDDYRINPDATDYTKTRLRDRFRSRSKQNVAAVEDFKEKQKKYEEDLAKFEIENKKHKKAKKMEVLNAILEAVSRDPSAPRPPAPDPSAPSGSGSGKSPATPPPSPVRPATPPPPILEPELPDYHESTAVAEEELKEKATAPDPNRVAPITPATGATQTADNANSKMEEATEMMQDVKSAASSSSSGDAAIFGDAEEKANMGKGEESGYEFNGPYDYPTRGSRTPYLKDASLVAVGAWRSKNGKHNSSLWKSGVTGRGTPAKRDRYYKWSSKKGGQWMVLNGGDASRTFSKFDGYKSGSRLLARPNPGMELSRFMTSQLKRRDRDNRLATIGGRNLSKVN